MMTGLLTLWLLGGVLGEFPEINVSPTAVEFAATDRLLGNALEQPISAEWKLVPLRQVIRRVTGVSPAPVLLDRRLDPDREVTLAIRDEQLLTLMNRLSAEQGGEARQIGHIIFAGPKRSARLVRTLIALRRGELQKSGFSDRRLHALVEHETLTWGDLARPADLLSQAGKKFSLRIEGLEKIPHDLWGRGALPRMGASEILTLLLVQYDLTFEWTSQGEAIRLIPLPEKVAITKSHAAPRGKSVEQTLVLWQREFPDAAMTLRGKEIQVTGTVEEHEALSGSKPTVGGTPAGKGPARIHNPSREVFSLKVPEVPLSALLKKLETPAGGNLVFTFDEEALKQAGISLEQRISLDVKNVSMQELLRRALDQANLSFEMHEQTVRLFPAKNKPREK